VECNFKNSKMHPGPVDSGHPGRRIYATTKSLCAAASCCSRKGLQRKHDGITYQYWRSKINKSTIRQCDSMTNLIIKAQILN
jgi:hypothetical protein